MVTKELLEYIKSQKAKGKTDDEIRADLDYNNWVDGDIEEALEKINKLDPNTPFEVEIKDRDKVFVIDDEVSHPATEARENLETPVGDKPKVVTSILSILFGIITFFTSVRPQYFIGIMMFTLYNFFYSILNMRHYTSWLSSLVKFRTHKNKAKIAYFQKKKLCFLSFRQEGEILFIKI